MRAARVRTELSVSAWPQITTVSVPKITKAKTAPNLKTTASSHHVKVGYPENPVYIYAYIIYFLMSNIKIILLNVMFLLLCCTLHANYFEVLNLR